jgi:dihydroorotase
MPSPTRREFLSQLGAGALVLRQPATGGSQPPGTPYDVLIAGGRVIDPSQGLSAERDIGIAAGLIRALAPAIPRQQARRVFDARGKIVTPGLVDMHGHVFDSVLPISIDPDLVGIPKGVTTIVDGGSAGAATFPGFRKHIIQRAATRIYALLNISTIGLVVTNELYIDPVLIDPKAAVRTIEANRDLILGLKVRVLGSPETAARDLEIMTLAREAADATGIPIMIHWSNDPKVLGLLKKGDIVTHPFNPPRAGFSLLGDNNNILPQILELRDRGIFTDFAHGTHLQWTIAERAAALGWFPDTISTDIHRAHVFPNGVVGDLPMTLAKFMYLGMTLEESIARVTSGPARILKFPEAVGSLAPGAVADVAVFDLVEGDVELLDSTRAKRTGRQRLVPVATVRAGRLSAV